MLGTPPVAAVTVRLKPGELIEFSVAVIVLVPVPAPEATPLALTAATVLFDEAQATLALRFCVVPSL
jgi:hypothetical protein